MIIHYLDLMDIFLCPGKAEPPAVSYADAVLAFAYHLSVLLNGCREEFLNPPDSSPGAAAFQRATRCRSGGSFRDGSRLNKSSASLSLKLFIIKNYITFSVISKEINEVKRQSGVIAELQFQGVGVQVVLLCEVGLVVFADIVVDQRHGHDEGQIAPPVMVDDVN